jgi:hypothetical protein
MKRIYHKYSKAIGAAMVSFEKALFDTNGVLDHMQMIPANSDIRDLTQGVTLIYEGGNTNSYRVSQKEGWSQDKKYFTKESLMIRADRCKEQ